MPVAVSGAPVQKGFSAMNFRILAASVRPRGRVFALLAATALSATLIASGAQAQQPAPGAPRRRKAARRRRPRRLLPRLRAGCPGRSRPRRPALPPPRPAAGTAGPADLRALDQVLPEGPGSRRQAGLLHRQGRPHRVRPAGHRRRHHRAGRRAEEDPARDAAARHAARARHPHHRRQQSRRCRAPT